MKFYLQFGYGMLAHTKHLISNWHDGAVIMSPRDMSLEQMQDLAKSVSTCGGKVFFDPQLYAPRGTHHGLQKYDYWPREFDTTDFFSTTKCRETIDKIIAINNSINSEEFILPGFFCKKVTGKWLEYHDKIINNSQSCGKPRLITICLSAEVVRSTEQMSRLLNEIDFWQVDGIYFVAAHPFNEYLVEDPVWFSSMLSFGAAIKLQQKKLVVGYASPQYLPFACVGADAIASGTWLNVRMFNEDKFNEPDTDAVSRRKIWYYCPQTLSEYQPEALTMAYRKNVLKSFSPPAYLNSQYADILFSGAPPDAVKFSEQNAFRHYLMCLYSQCKYLSGMSYEDTFSKTYALLTDISENLKRARRIGVLGRDRDFSIAIDATKTGLSELNNDFEVQLRMTMNADDGLSLLG